MACLLVDLKFNDVGDDGVRSLRTFPAGTPLHEPRGDSDELKYCQSRVFELARRGEPDFVVLLLGGLPRILHRRFFEANYVTRSNASFTEGVSNARGKKTTQERRPAGENQNEGFRGMAGCDHPRRDPVPDGMHNERAGDGDGPAVENRPGGRVAAAQSVPGLHGGQAVDRQRVLNCGVVCVVDVEDFVGRFVASKSGSGVDAAGGLLDVAVDLVGRFCPEFIVFAVGPAADCGPRVRIGIDLAVKALAVIGWPIVNGCDSRTVAASMAWQVAEAAAGVVIVSHDSRLRRLLNVRAPGVSPVVFEPLSGGWRINRVEIIREFGPATDRPAQAVPIAVDWQNAPVQSVRENWAQGLEGLGLGGVVKRLAKVIPSGVKSEPVDQATRPRQAASKSPQKKGVLF